MHTFIHHRKVITLEAVEYKQSSKQQTATALNAEQFAGLNSIDNRLLNRYPDIDCLNRYPDMKSAKR